LAVVWVIFRQTKFSNIRQLLVFILSIFALSIMFFIFGLWGIIQVIINVCKYFAGPKKYELTGDNIISFLWAKPHPVFDGILDIWAGLRGAPLSSSL